MTATRIMLRRGTTSQWSTANPVLAAGELGVDLSTGEVRIGDGSTAWTASKTMLKKWYGHTLSVIAFGAKGDGQTDDGPAIAACNAASMPGDIILFPATGLGPAGVTNYVTGSEILNRAGRAYCGGLARPGSQGVRVTQKTGVDLRAVFISEAYTTNATSCGEPYRIDYLSVFGGADVGNDTGCGFIVMNYNTTLEHCYASHTPQHGYVWSDTNSAGTVIDGTMSNCIMRDCNSFETGGDGCWVKDTGGSGCIVDGTMENCYFEYSGGHGLHHQRFAGWFLNHIHSTASGLDGVRLEHCRDGHGNDIQVDGFGTSNNGTVCVGFNIAGLMAGRHCTFDNIHVSVGEGSSPLTNYIYVRVNNQDSGTDTRIGMTNVKCTQDTAGGASSVGLSLQSNSGTLTFIDDPTNDFRGLPTSTSTGVYRYDTSGRIDRYLETMNRDTQGIAGASSAPTVTPGTVALTYRAADQTMPCGNLFSAVMDQAMVGATLAKMGVYLVDPSTGNLTCIARTASDPSLWATTNLGYTRTIADDGQGHAITSVMLQQGWIYAFAILHVGSSANPRFAGHVGLAALMPGAGPASRRMGFVQAQTDLPATIAGTVINANTTSGSTFYIRATP